ncbi:dicarboxylate transporter/tellurite-resistance protein TehA [Gemmatimonas groenlandica]|uniref:Dicarboxylate transporter/tellurite-resistance protein TehA n=1 Tax=Gemmatimonas groenlandica TaxID=2732249 RepID=A0A6M4IJN8_9BACT|nr:dicarboxylate transporter/tellurite-resistance protein TehA [Gemmatimonas groenlandica]QJR34058.1 dicarboxylate transporter/tellurite-resistance protein TehA [Gemmatimonas groenlandica]
MTAASAHVARLGAIEQIAARTPASFFAVALGVAGLGGDWRAASELWGLPSFVGEAIMAAAVLVWLMIAALYAGKWIVARDAALTEWRHPVQCCFIALGPVATMLVALAVRPYNDVVARVLFAVGAVSQVGFAVWRTGGLWDGGRDPLATTPVLYLPTVAGSLVLGTVAGTLGHTTLAALALGAGFFSWLALESIILHRLLVHEPLSPALLPTLGIQLAPPTVGCVAYLGITRGPPDLFALALLGYGLLQAGVLLRIAARLRTQPFTLGFWAFSFGVTALAQGAIRVVARGAVELEVLSIALFTVANIVIAALALRTLLQVSRGRLLPPAS